MLQIPKNVMQIGESNPYCKIYMEDYVHTFLKQRTNEEIYLAFGKKEEADGVVYYLIYGVEKKTDWDRGSMPYFKKFDRLGTMEGTAEKRIFRPVRHEAITMDGYFVFYEQNEDMQSYMITVREKEDAKKERDAEREAVLEAVKARREVSQERLEPAKNGKTEPKRSVYREKYLTRRKGQSVIARWFFNPVTQPAARKKKQQKDRHIWTVPEICRVASLCLLVILLVAGLTSVNGYSDMREMGAIFGGAVQNLKNMKEEQNVVLLEDTQNDFIIEETQITQENEMAAVQTAGTVLQESEAEAAEETQDSISWTIGTENAAEENDRKDIPAETVSTAEAEPETETEQGAVPPETYVVKKGDNLAEICRRFYGDTSRLYEICDINKIENPNQIQPGQNILLP